ncbi:unnamed protein product, partial [Darwinula stevensoni]
MTWKISRLRFALTSSIPSVVSNVSWGFFVLDPEVHLQHFKIKPSCFVTVVRWKRDLDEEGGYRKLVRLLEVIGPDLKVTLAVSWWGEGRRMYLPLAMGPARRESFVRSVVEYPNKHDFDRFDLDWEYPGAADGSESCVDEDNFLYFCQESSEAFAAVGKRWELTAAVLVDLIYEYIISTRAFRVRLFLFVTSLMGNVFPKFTSSI